MRQSPLFRDPDWLAANQAGLDEFFPAIDPGILPSGSRVLVQIRTPRTKSKSGLVFVTETKEIDKWNQQLGRVVALGPLAFCNRDTGQPWTEGAWCDPGDFVRAVKWGGDRWEVPIPGRPDETAMFLICNDLDVIGTVTGDPLEITAINLNL